MHLKSIRPMHCLPPSPDGTQINIVEGRFYLRKAGGYDCDMVDHYVNKRKIAELKVCVRIGNAAEHTYFKWDKLCFVLSSVMAADAIFYIFKEDLIGSDKVWWTVKKHFRHLTANLDMETNEEFDRLKKDYAGKKCYVIKTDLGNLPKSVTSVI